MFQEQYQSRERHPVVLVVDDNDAIRDMVSWALELDGYEAAEAAEGQEALEWMSNAAREGCYPEVILLDLAMPGMDGSTFLTHLHQQWDAPHALPAIIVITAAGDSVRPPDARQLGVNHVMVKPFHVRDLLDLVQELITTNKNPQ
jgi:two-component system chemotaxis response regulator CheY